MKRKILSAVISGILMVSTITCFVPEMTVIAQAATTYGTVNGDNVNIRESTSTSSKSLGKLNKGTRVQILSSTNGWYKIKWGNITGFMSLQYVIKDSAKTNEIAISKVGYIKVNTSLNVRKSPSTSSESLGKLTNGIKVNIVAQTTDKKWYKIKYNNGYGYVSCDYVTDKKPNDCSGFVSFVLGLQRLDTSALATNTYTTLIDKKDLQPGDILDNPGHHTFMFKKWADANHTKMVVLEQTEPKAAENTKSLSSLGKYQARRLNKLV